MGKIPMRFFQNTKSFVETRAFVFYDHRFPIGNSSRKVNFGRLELSLYIDLCFPNFTLLKFSDVKSYVKPGYQYFILS